MRKVGVIDLFSGCGGSALGFSQVGLPIKVAVDIDVKASASFKANFPECTVFPVDISSKSGADLLKAGGFKNGKEVILIACPPCQGFSNARRNTERESDPRNKLVYEFLRLVKEIKPFYFVMENVPGLATGIGKALFIQILQTLNDLGYRTIYDVFHAADFGVPQNRKRLILLGTNLSNIELIFPKKTNSDPVFPSNLPQWKTVRDAIGDLPEIEAGGKHNTDALHTSARLSETNLRRIKHTAPNGGDRTLWPKELVLECHNKREGHKDVYGRMWWDRPSPTITGGCAMISKGRFGHPRQNRAISLREAARLQTFPDNYKFLGNFGQIAEQIGNAVPPVLARKVAQVIITSIKTEKKFTP